MMTTASAIRAALAIGYLLTFCGVVALPQEPSCRANDPLDEAVRAGVSLIQLMQSGADPSTVQVAQSKPDPSTGIWQEEDLRNRRNGGLNECMAKELLQLMAQNNYTSSLDLGAGSGAYSVYMDKHMSGKEVRCCDGNAAVVEASGGLCSVCDLTTPQEALKPAQLVFSLEVAEHIPKDKEAAFLSNIESKSQQLLVISWAIPGQKGDGHVNCQPNEHAIHRMRERGFTFCSALTEDIRQKMLTDKCRSNWNSEHFSNTLLVFGRGHGSHC